MDEVLFLTYGLKERIWATGVLNEDTSDSSNSTIYATILRFSGSKYYLNLSTYNTLNNGTCQLYFMCF